MQEIRLDDIDYVGGVLRGRLYHWMDGRPCPRCIPDEPFVWVREWVHVGPNGYAVLTPKGVVDPAKLKELFASGELTGRVEWKHIENTVAVIR